MALAALPLAAQHHYDDRNWRLDEKETIRKSFDVGSGGGRKLLVDNIQGYVHVTGGSGHQVQVTIEKYIYADSTEAMAEGKRDVKMDLSQQGNFVRAYEDGPFRTGNGTNYRGDNYYGYRVIFDCDIEVPADTELSLRTVNHGDIQVKKTTGDYEISGLNGGIEMDDVTGSGSVHTLNGKVKVTYTRNPAKATSFKTLNGQIDVYFAGTPDADLHFRKLNGAIYSDFEMTMLPNGGSTNSEGARWVYHSDRNIGGRAGKGGPELSFETLNGSIRLHAKTL
jgi:hypothetical protein